MLTGVLEVPVPARPSEASVTTAPTSTSQLPARLRVDERVRRARALLMRLSGGAPTPPLGELILTEGPVAAAETVLGDPAIAAGCGVVVEPDVRERAAADLERAAQLGARLLTPEDPDWPQVGALVSWQRSTGELAALVEVAGLWVRGPAALAGGRRITVVGSRA